MKKKQGLWLALYHVIRDNPKLVGTGVFLTLIGGGLIEVVIMDKESFGGRGLILGLVSGGLFLLPGIAILATLVKAVIAEKEREVAEPKDDIPAEGHELSRSLEQFRRGLNDFFQEPANVQNHAIQGFVTQVYFQIIHLQKRRLLKKGIRLTIQTKQKQHGGQYSEIPLIRERRYDDGKYRISLAREQISGEKTFWRNGQSVHRTKAEQVADYTLLTAFRRGKDKIVCPGCGNTTTRENLLDGCDYCRTRFTVEDLGERVQSFSFASDYRVQYAEYRRIRNLVLKWGTRLGGIPVMIFIGFAGILSFVESWQKGEPIGPFIGLFGGLVAVAFFGIVSTAIVAFFLWFVLLPVVQLIAGIGYIGKKKLQQSREREERNEAAEFAAKRNDPAFSLHGFFGNIHNKLAMIHFAETEKEIQTFADCDLRMYLPQYKDVIDMEVEMLRLDQYFVQQQFQHAEVSVVLNLLFADGGRITAKKEKIQLLLVKSALCKTQAVTGPEVIRCQSCGSGILLLEGRHCRYCGSQVPLSAYDWVITGYQIS